ncbi:ribonuclease H-like domain-containing protein [Tanacetum coccineum]
MKLMQFFMCLYDSYMQIRSFVLSRETLSGVRSAYATISSEESNRVASDSVIEKVGESGLVCENYGFNGHIIDRCFKLIGYYADFGKKKSRQNFKGINISNNNIVGSSSSTGFTDEQMSNLISLIKDTSLNGKNVKANMTCTLFKNSRVFNENFKKFFCSNTNIKPKLVSEGKIVDLGENQHMNHTDKELDNVYDISHLRIKVGHPNGIEAFISNIRNIILSNGLVLPKSHKKFDGEYPKIPNDDENRSLNSDYKSQSDSSHSSVPGEGVDTDDFPSGNFGNDAQSSDDTFAAHNEQSDFVETVYMKQPKEYFPLGDNKVCRLKKSLYSLKQAPRRWNAKLTSSLIENGFSQSKSDYSLYIKSDKGVFVALLVYVDDIIITGNSISEIEKFKTFFKSKFMIKDLRELKYFFGIEVIDTDKGASRVNGALNNMASNAYISLLQPATYKRKSEASRSFNKVQATTLYFMSSFSSFAFGKSKAFALIKYKDSLQGVDSEELLEDD